jgi:SAM-dependent methyltransferase
VRPRAENHRPDPKRLPGIVMVGDYMFDATLNGVLDSADAGTDIILAEILRRRHAEAQESAGVIGAANWSRAVSTEEVIEHLFSVETVRDILSVTWALEKGAKILHVGSASGRMVGALRALGYDAIGVECNRLASLATPAQLYKYNLFCTFSDLPFEDQAFDAVIETGLCRLPQEAVSRAIEEIRRVTRHGVVLGSVTTDLPIDLIERHDLLEGVKMLGSRWDWSEKFYAAGFVHALSDTSRLDEAWKKAEAAGAGPGQWYEDAESLLYCVYEPASAAGQVAKDVKEKTENFEPVEPPSVVAAGV